MKFFYLLVILLSIALAGCSSGVGRFQSEAIAFITNDNKIDQNEYELLVKHIKDSNDKGFAQFLDGDREVDHAKLSEYLLKLAAAKKLSLAAENVWNPKPVNTTIKFNVDVYIENSASMDGYVKGATDFETGVYSLLGALKTSELCDRLNLNYINKQVTYTKSNVPSEEIQDFIEKLEPATFKQMGGDRSTSDIRNILQTVLEKVDDNNLAVLVSDFVYSRGKNVNSEDFLNTQSLGTRIRFHEKLQKFHLSVMVIQLQSNFDGIYYDKSNKSIPLKSARPYYVWLLGSDTQIRAILDRKILENMKGGYLHRQIFNQSKEMIQAEHKTLLRPRIGTFELKEGARGSLSSAELARDQANKGVFAFTVAVKFVGSLQEPEYFLNPGNYHLSNSKYTLSIEAVDPSDTNLRGFTHKLTFKTNELIDETLKIDVIGKMPSWIDSSNSIDDSNIAFDDNEKKKTFGLKPLLEGVNDAFYPPSSENIINTLSITIKK